MDRFNAKQYIPILRWKEAEHSALTQLDNSVLAEITPLIELIPENFMHTDKKGKDVILSSSDVTNKVIGQLFKYWGERPLYIDLFSIPKNIVTQWPAHPLNILGQYAVTSGLSLVPVTGIERELSYQNATFSVHSIHKKGVCIRLSLQDLGRTSLIKDLNALLSFLKITPDQADILIDYQFVEVINNSQPTLTELYNLLPIIRNCRNFILASGAFPKDLSKLKKNEQHDIQRLDWIFWKNQITSKSSETRGPCYSDYTIQHALYSRHQGKLRYSASIRYTTENRWIIMRGEDVFKRNGLGFKQYPDWAILLSELPQFCGEGYSDGDKYIKDMSLQSAKTGDAATWLQAGINHHITFVVHQLANFFDTSTIALS